MLKKRFSSVKNNHNVNYARQMKLIPDADFALGILILENINKNARVRLLSRQFEQLFLRVPLCSFLHVFRFLLLLFIYFIVAILFYSEICYHRLKSEKVLSVFKTEIYIYIYLQREKTWKRHLHYRPAHYRT